jgi:beta-barrel assembly-enhancing protease
MTRDEQIHLGFQAASQVYQQMPVLPDSSPETQYIRKLGQELVATIPPQHSWPFEFHVIPQKEINAFALPGGPMFVNIGTITAASNEAELAGVMAHEMSHVYMQHSAKLASKSQTTATITGISEAILGATTKGALGSLAQAGIQFGAEGLILKYSRGDEAQADAVGAIILYKSGYNPQAMADFFKKLTAEGSPGPQFLSDHPNPGNREAAIQKEIASWPAKSYSTTSAAFTATRQRAMGIKAYSAQEIAQGAKSGEWARSNKQNGAVFEAPSGVGVAGLVSAESASTARPMGLQSVLPSSRLVTSDLGPLKIAHPDNWQVIAPAQRGQDVRIAPATGISGNALGYGVAINGIKPQNGQTMNLDQLTAELVRAMRSGGDLSPLGNAEPISVAGVQGRSVAMQSTSPFPDENGQPQKERDWLVTVPLSDGSLVYFVFVAPQSEFERFRPSYENMLKSLQFPQ